MSENRALDVEILLYANKHKGYQRDLLKLSSHVKIRSIESLISALKNLEEENFLVTDPRIWRLTAKGEATASVIETSQRNHMHLLLLCVALCVVLVLTIVVKNL